MYPQGSPGATEQAPNLARVETEPDRHVLRFFSPSTLTISVPSFKALLPVSELHAMAANWFCVRVTSNAKCGIGFPVVGSTAVIVIGTLIPSPLAAYLK